MNVVYAATSTIIGHAGVTVHLRLGETWAADDPLVTARPDLFAATPPVVHRTGPVVEQATAAPGEKRTTRRPVARTA